MHTDHLDGACRSDRERDLCCGTAKILYCSSCCLLLVGQTGGSGMLLQVARALSPTLNSCVKRESIIIDSCRDAGPAGNSAASASWDGIRTSSNSCRQRCHMFSRLNQVSRHFARPLPNYLHNSAFAGSVAMAQERSKRTINTAACLIIGDEVLGGKVSEYIERASRSRVYLLDDTLTSIPDSRHQLRLLRKVLLLSRHQPQAHRSHRRR